MIRGRFVLVRTDADGERHIHVSTEFNGGMGANELADVLFSYDSGTIHDVKEWEAFIERFNQEHHGYSDVVLYEDLAEYPEENPCELVTSYVGRSDYSYWLNLADEDVEVLTKEGVVLIPTLAGAAFGHKSLCTTDWAHLIPAKESKDFRMKGQAYEYLHKNILSNKDVKEWLSYVRDENYEIIEVYPSVEELGENKFQEILISGFGLTYDKAQNLLYEIESYMDYDGYAEDLLMDDGYMELTSGKVIRYVDTDDESYPEKQKDHLTDEDLLSCTHVLCYEENGKPVWEEILGDDAMEIRVGELMEELNLDADEILVFRKDTQL